MIESLLQMMDSHHVLNHCCNIPDVSLLSSSCFVEKMNSPLHLFLLDALELEEPLQSWVVGERSWVWIQVVATLYRPHGISIDELASATFNHTTGTLLFLPFSVVFKRMSVSGYHCWKNNWISLAQKPDLPSSISSTLFHSRASEGFEPLTFDSLPRKQSGFKRPLKGFRLLSLRFLTPCVANSKLRDLLIIQLAYRGQASTILSTAFKQLMLMPSLNKEVQIMVI